MTANTQISTLTFFKFSSLWQKIWAFHMMLLAHIPLRKVKGVSFYKLMGSGKDKGFNPYPDWSVYCLLQVWDTEAQAKSFFAHAPIIKAYTKHTQERYTLYMKTIASHGTWDGKQPFEKTTELNPTAPIAIITRASINGIAYFVFGAMYQNRTKPWIVIRDLFLQKVLARHPYCKWLPSVYGKI